MLRGRFRFVVAATLLLLALTRRAPSEAQTPATASGQPFKSSATAILVDVVVRDSKGAPVLDLAPSDFELWEDDVPQRIGSVSLVAPDTPAGAAAASTLVTPAPAGASASADDATPPGTPDGAKNAAAARPTLIAFVFHRLSPEARALSHQAALAYVKQPARADDYAGVFQIDQALTTIQTYTSDRERIRQAIDAVSARASSVYVRQPASTSGSAGGDRDPSVSPTAGAESAGRPVRDAGFTPRTAQVNGDRDSNVFLELMRERMEEQYETTMRSQQGNATVNGLIALLDSLRELPGRKTVVLFAEALSIPSDIQPRFQEIISVANRANVSIYTMDAAGLRVQSEQASTARAVARIGFAATGDVVPGDPDDPSSAAMTRRLERNEFILRQDPNAALGLLAKETGGFLIDSTNDLADAFGRIDRDRRFHYLLTYSPANAAQDGTYRTIRVKVRRQNVEVRARGGYYATPGTGMPPTLRLESAALAALAQVPRPTQIPVRAGLFQFPDPAQPGRLALIVSVPEREVGHLVNDARTSYRTDFTILARLTDANGVEVRKGSLPYQLTGPAADVERAGTREVLFYRQPTLPPGRYGFEYIVYDALTTHAGAAIEAVSVEAPAAGAPLVSSLVIVRRAEQVPAGERDPHNPLYCGDLLLYPNLGEPLHQSVDQALTFFYTAYPGATGGPLTATLAIESATRTVANLPLTLPPADAAGRIQHLARLPLTSVPPGRYTLRLTIANGATDVTRTAAFTVAP